MAGSNSQNMMGTEVDGCRLKAKVLKNRSVTELSVVDNN